MELRRAGLHSRQETFSLGHFEWCDMVPVNRMTPGTHVYFEVTTGRAKGGRLLEPIAVSRFGDASTGISYNVEPESRADGFRLAAPVYYFLPLDRLQLGYNDFIEDFDGRITALGVAACSMAVDRTTETYLGDLEMSYRYLMRNQSGRRATTIVTDLL